MNLKALQSLVTIHDCQSFLEAARRLGVNQSSISMQIKALEEYLGVELFDRSVRPPAMTRAAIAIVQPAREILALLDVVQERARHPAALAGQLLLGAISTSTLVLLPDALTAIQRRYPAIQIRVESGLSAFLIEHVSRGILDAAVVTEPQVLPDGLRSDVIMRERLALVSAIGSKGPACVADLSQHRFIRFNRKVGVGEIIDPIPVSMAAE